MWWVLGFVVLLWITFNLLVPFSVVQTAQPMGIGRIPADILFRANTEKVHYYVDKLMEVDEHGRMTKGRGVAYTAWLGNMHIVVIDQTFLKRAQPAQIRFVLAHELAHCALGHVRQRWLAVVSGLVLLPFVRRKLKDLEDEADTYAETLSGLPKEVLTQQDLASLHSLLDKIGARGSVSAIK